MSTIKAGKIQTGISVTPANNFVFDASADDGSMIIKRASGTEILAVNSSGIVDIGGSGELYGKENILGIVSQLAGVPTGKLIESDSNANGRYLMFADGTIIAWGNITAALPAPGLYVTGLYSTVYAQAAPVNLPSGNVWSPIACGGADQTSYGWGAPRAGSTNTAISFTFYTKSTTITSSAIWWSAIGRWF